MEHNVVTLDTAKKLKAAGFPQDSNSYFVWREYNFVRDVWEWNLSDRETGGFAYRAEAVAPTAQEICDQLPKLVEGMYFLSVCYPVDLWVASYTSSSAHPHPSQISRTRYDSTGDTMAEALALLTLKLVESGGLKF